jgi:hypothetical protein
VLGRLVRNGANQLCVFFITGCPATVNYFLQIEYAYLEMTVPREKKKRKSGKVNEIEEFKKEHSLSPSTYIYIYIYIS